MHSLRIDIGISNLITIPPEEFMCPICLDNNTDTHIIKLKCCNQYLHLDCINDYWKHTSIVCPLCRENSCPFCLGSGC